MPSLPKQDHTHRRLQRLVWCRLILSSDRMLGLLLLEDGDAGKRVLLRFVGDTHKERTDSRDCALVERHNHRRHPFIAARTLRNRIIDKRIKLQIVWQPIPLGIGWECYLTLTHPRLVLPTVELVSHRNLFCKL
jgi:hypothetical protein